MSKKTLKEQPVILNHLDTEALKRKSKKFFLDDFKKFWVNQQIINLVIGVIVGQALANFVRAIITDWFTPIITFLMGNNNISKGLAIGPIVFQYSDILTELVNLLVNGIVVYLFLHMWRSAFMTKAELAAPSEQELLTKVLKEAKQSNKIQRQQQILLEQQAKQNQQLIEQLLRKENIKDKVKEKATK